MRPLRPTLSRELNAENGPNIVDRSAIEPPIKFIEEGFCNGGDHGFFVRKVIGDRARSEASALRYFAERRASITIASNHVSRRRE